METGDSTGRFSPRAEAHGRHRPGYPEAALDCLLAARDGRVDLARSLFVLVKDLD